MRRGKSVELIRIEEHAAAYEVPAAVADSQQIQGLVVETIGRNTLVIVPTYNERANIIPLLTAVLEIDRPIDILVIDDASPDGTGKVVDAHFSTNPRVTVAHRTGKLGLGTAYSEGFRYALACQYDYVIEMDADFSHRPEDIPRLLEAIHDADVVIASRNVPGGVVIGWSPVRHLISKAGSVYARTLLGLPIRDCTAGFKCFRRSALEVLNTASLQSRGYGFQVEVNFVCTQAGLRIVEIPVVFPDRKQGASKMSGGIALEAAFVVLQLAVQRLRYAVSRSSPIHRVQPFESGHIVAETTPRRNGELVR